MNRRPRFPWPGALLMGALGMPLAAAAAPAAMRVTLPENVQAASGIAVTRLAPAHYRPQVTGYGRVIDLTDLLTLRARLQAAQARLSASRQEYLRLAGLYRHGRNASVKSLQAARAVWQADRAEVAALRAQAIQQWGPVLARALATGGPLLAGLADGRERLLRIGVPGVRALHPPGHLEIGGGARAMLVSAAPEVNAEIQAPAYFYRTASVMSIGLQFTVGVPVAAQALTGVRVPGSAVIWYGGRAWAYVRTGATEFERRPVSTAHADDGGWFVTGAIQAGDELVTSGAELLFADELAARAQGGGNKAAQGGDDD